MCVSCVWSQSFYLWTHQQDSCRQMDTSECVDVSISRQQRCLSISLSYRAIIISGSPGSINKAPPTSSLGYDPSIFSLGIPVLGICYGMQLIGHYYGGKVASGEAREDGQFTVQLDTNCPLFAGLEERQEVWSHVIVM